MPDTLLHMAMADAYAMAWEFVSDPAQRPRHDWSGYRPNPQIPSHEASRYSDDTMRALVNARVLLEADPFDPLAYVRALKEEFRGDRRGGWSKTFRAHLTEHLDRPDEEWLPALRPRNTNGGIMGAAVCGFLADPRDVMRAAEAQARATHDAEAAVFASGAALALHGLRTGAAPRRELHAYACGHDPRLAALMPELPRDIPAGSMLASDTLAAALHIVARCHDFRGILDRTVAHGGDTDSIAALAMAIASVDDRFIANQPDWAARDLECGDKAAQARLLAVGRALEALDPRP